ncbi:MAG: YHYH protein [Flavobacteriales bacterium]|nr:YHYH protein [Flavobacteriales bacterium]
MTRTTLAALCLLAASLATAQIGPNITEWLYNTTGVMGQHYVQGNSTPIQDNVLANVQQVDYSADWVYMHTHGIPAYITGPFLDGNPSLATDQDAIFRIPRDPVQNTGTPAATTPGNIGVFINGVALFDYRDGVAWNTNTNALCGGPGNPPCPGGMGTTQAWNRDAVPAERAGFDCAKAHPAMGNYHHHQNPSAFNLDLVEVSNICDLYASDGLYAIDAAQHSPLLGFAYDGFPIYGAYGHANADGSGGITRIRSGYQLRDITVRTHHADGTDVADGPAVSTTYPLGYFREDYEFIAHSEPYYLDVHNGRYCVTPEYPDGTYAYFCTVDENWNSAYPYIIGPTFYGVLTGGSVTSVTESVTTFDPLTTGLSGSSLSNADVAIFPNPASDLIAIQVSGLLRESLDVYLYDAAGKEVRHALIVQGSTIWHLDTRTLYDGAYVVRIGQGDEAIMRKILIAH